MAKAKASGPVFEAGGESFALSDGLADDIRLVTLLSAVMAEDGDPMGMADKMNRLYVLVFGDIETALAAMDAFAADHGGEADAAGFLGALVDALNGGAETKN